MSLFNRSDVPEPRTKRELAICKKIVRLSFAIEEDPAPDEGYRRIKERRKELYMELDKICKEDCNRYDENIIFIKELLGKLRRQYRPKKTKVGGRIGGTGFDVERDDRPNG